MIYRCVVCDRTLCNRADFLTAGIPWIVKLEDDYVCADCVRAHDGPGKFEGCRGYHRSSLGIGLILYAWSMVSAEDDLMTSEGWGYCGRFGKYLLFEDTNGAVTYEDCGSIERAEKRFNVLYDDGMGANEDDAYIESNGFRYSVSFEGKSLDVWAPKHTDEITERRCVARVRLESMRKGFYPNLWIVSDHGNLIRRDY